MRILQLLLLSALACGQIQTFTGVSGLGHSTMTCVDRDGDGYGVGPSVVINTTLSSPASVGATMISVASATGISANSVLRLDLVQSMERVVVANVSGTTLTVAPLLLAHASGVSVTDQNCLGRDADDNDPLVWTGAQAITKYGSLAGLFTKIGNDIILDNPIPNGSAAAIGAGYSAPASTVYLAPATPTGGCTGTIAQCTGSDSNNCILSAPCLTFAHAATQGYTTSSMAILRDGWNGMCSPHPGTSAKYSVVIAYPGELPKITGGAGNNCSMVGTSGSPFDYIVIDGLAIGSGSAISGGSQDVGTAPYTSTAFHDILLRNIEGAGGTAAGTGIGWIAAFNGLVDFTIEYSNLHGNDCTGGGCQHGAYNGSRMMVSAYVTYRRNLAWGNDSNGLTFNGQCTPGCVFSQNVSYSNGISGMTFEEGVSNALIESNLLFSNANGGLTIFNYPGNCATQGGSSGNAQICPFDQTGNLIENNTIWQTGNANVANPNSSIGSCPVGISFCTQGGINISNTTSPLAGNLGTNVYRNNIVSSYGYLNHYPPTVYGDPSSSGICDSTCTGWISADTWDHDLFFQTDGNNGAGTIAFGPGGGFGFQGYTCSTATAHTTMTACLDGDPKMASEAIAHWNAEALFDLRLLASSPAYQSGAATGIPTADIAGRAFLDDKPARGALERNPFSFGWNDLGSATKVACPADGFPSSTNNISYTGTAGSLYPFSTECSRAILTWSDGAHYHGTGNHMLLIFGGGHSDYIGNEMNSWRYWQSSPAWTRISGPSTFTGDPGTGATFSSTISGGALSTCTVTAGGSGYIGQGEVVWSGGGGSGAEAIYTESGGTVVSCTPKFNALGSGYTGAPTGTTPNYSTPVLAWANSYPALPQLSDGSMSSIHTTGLMSLSQTDGKILFWNGGLAGGNGPHFQQTFTYDPRAAAWSRKDPTTCSGCVTGSVPSVPSVGSQFRPETGLATGFSGCSVWNPLNDTHFYISDQGSGAEQLVYQESTGAWLYGGFQGAWSCNGAASSNGAGRDIIPDRQIAYFIGSTGTGGTPVYFGLKTNLTVVLSSGTSATSVITSSISTSGGTSCAGWWQQVNGSSQYYAPGLAWDQAIGKFVAWIFDGSGNWWTLDPDALTCTAYTASGAPAQSNNPWAFGKVQYDPTIDAFPVYQGFNTAGTASQDAFVLSLNAPDPTPLTCSITPGSLLSGTVGTPYSQTLSTSSCGSGPFAWTVTAGSCGGGSSLPTGLSIGSSSGVVSGTPNTTSGSPFTFNIHVTDGGSNSADQCFTVSISGPSSIGGVGLSGPIRVSGFVSVH